MARGSSDSLLLDPLPPVPDFAFEARARSAGHRAVAGVDEAGRGPLAGPVVAAAVILDPRAIPEGLNDSKKLSAARRDALFEMILASASVAVASTSPRQIDATNILAASLDAMRRAVASLAATPSHVLVDGRDVPPGLACSGEAVVKGDSLCVSIAAASIVAKVMRDRLMRRAHLLHPEYGFDRHVGYATADHRLAIERAGPCPLHRLSFGTVRRVHTETAATED